MYCTVDTPLALPANIMSPQKRKTPRRGGPKPATATATPESAADHFFLKKKVYDMLLMNLLMSTNIYLYLYYIVGCGTDRPTDRPTDRGCLTHCLKV